jgi:site-specific DNA-cytosine methylase
MSSGQANAEIREDGGATTLTCPHEAPIVAHAFKASHFTRGKDGAPSEIVPPLSADADKGDQDTLVLAHAFDARQSDVIQYGDMTGPLDTDGHTIGVLAFSGKDHGADAMLDLSPTLRAGGHHKSHANGGVAPAIAFSIMPMNSGKDYKARETDVAQPLMAGGPVGGNQGGDFIVQPLPFDTTQITSPLNYSNPQPGDPCHPLTAAGHAPALALTSVVRRLTPTECERLQGFPEIHRVVTVRVCSSEEEKHALASSADPHSAAQKRALSEPAAAHVLIDCERSAVQIRKAGKLIWSANGAEPSSACPLSMPLADFVRLAVLMTTTAVPQIQAGKAASPPSINDSLPQWTGSALVPVSGRATGDLASDVARLAAAVTTSTTSQPGRHSQQSGSTLEILSCCVVAAIASCIREKIQPGNSFSVSVETRAGYTQVPVGNKPTADGPRYKQLGNSMAVPCMRWLGERIAMVESLMERAAA